MTVLLAGVAFGASVDVLVVGGGGAGGWDWGGGGGGAQVVTTTTTVNGSVNVVVGAGGPAPAGYSTGANGSASSFGSISANGGGGGGCWANGGTSGANGGGGGGGGGPGAIPWNGYYGASSSGDTAGGGGGAGGAASGENGGAGVSYWGMNLGGGGGGGGQYAGYGQHGGGNGHADGIGDNGTPNTGGGGAGGGFTTVSFGGGGGGSGIVVVRYPGSTQKGTGGSVSIGGGYVYHFFYSSGTFTYIDSSPQTISLTQTVPNSQWPTVVQVGQPMTAQVTGSSTGYVGSWGTYYAGVSGASFNGSTGAWAVTPSASGYMTYSVYAPASGSYLQSNTVTIVLNVADKPTTTISGSVPTGNTGAANYIYTGQTSTITTNFTADSAHGDLLGYTMLACSPNVPGSVAWGWNGWNYIDYSYVWPSASHTRTHNFSTTTAGTYHFYPVMHPGSYWGWQYNTGDWLVNVANQPTTAISVGAPSIAFGQSVTVTGTYGVDTAHGDSLVYTILASNGPVIPSGGSQGGPGWGGAGYSYYFSWYGDARNANSNTVIPTTIGTYNFYPAMYSGIRQVWTNWSNASASVTINKATPSVSGWTNQSRTGTGTFPSAFTAVFSNPYSGSVAAPTGAVSYSVVAVSGTGATPTSGAVGAGTSFAPGSYTVRAYYGGDGSYNAASADVTFTVANVAQSMSFTLNGTTNAATGTNNAPSINFGQSFPVSSTVTDPDGNLIHHGMMIQLSTANVWLKYPGTNYSWWGSYTDSTSWTTISQPAGNTVSSGASNTITGTFLPATAGVYLGVAYSFDAPGSGPTNVPYVNIVVNKVTPSGTFANATKTPTTAGTASYTIIAGDLNAAFANPYNGSVAAPSGAVTYSIAPSSPNGTPGSSVTAGSILGSGLTYIIRATYPGDTNYLSTTADSTWTISKAAQTAVTITSSSSTTYGNTYTATASGGNGSGSLVWTLAAGSTASGAAINSSTGAITANSTGTVAFNVYRASNTNFLQSATSANFTVTVGARPITINLGGGKIYDTTTSSPGATAAITSGSLAPGDSIGYVFSNTASANAGSYTGLTVPTISNGTAPTTRTTSYSISHSGSYVISKANQPSVTITSPSSSVYGDSYAATASGGAGTGAIVWALGSGSTAAGAAINSSTGVITANSNGAVVITAYRAGDTNYNQSATTSGFTVTVNKRLVTVTVGGSKAYNGNSTPTGRTVTITSGSWASGDSPSYTYAINLPSPNVGSYAGSTLVSMMSVDNATVPNDRLGSYTITINGTYTITKASQAAVSITSGNSVIYGGSYTATASGGSGTGAIVWALGTGSTASSAAINSSTGAVTANSTGIVMIVAYRAGDSNYLQSATTANFAVNVGSRAITVTLSGYKPHDGTRTPFGASAAITSGSLAPGDSVTYSFTDTNNSAIGTYTGLTGVVINNAAAPATRTANYAITHNGFYAIAQDDGVIIFDDAIPPGIPGFAATSTTRTARILNNGNSNLVVNSFTTSGDYSNTSSTPTTIVPGASTDVVITFAPTVLGLRTGTLYLISNDQPRTVIVCTLQAYGRDPRNPPISTLTSATSSVFAGTPIFVSLRSTDVGNTMNWQEIDYLTPGSSTWVSGTVVAGSAWSGPVTTANTLSFAINAGAALGTWQFRGSATNAFGTAMSPTVSVNVVASPASAGATNYLVNADDLNTVFHRKVSGATAPATGYDVNATPLSNWFDDISNARPLDAKSLGAVYSFSNAASSPVRTGVGPSGMDAIEFGPTVSNAWIDFSLHGVRFYNQQSYMFGFWARTLSGSRTIDVGLSDHLNSGATTASFTIGTSWTWVWAAKSFSSAGAKPRVFFCYSANGATFQVAGAKIVRGRPTNYITADGRDIVFLFAPFGSVGAPP